MNRPEKGLPFSEDTRLVIRRLSLLGVILLSGASGVTCWVVLKATTGFFFQWVLLSIWLSGATLFCALVWWMCREQAGGRSSRAAIVAGPLFFLLVMLGFYGAAQLVFWELNRIKGAQSARTGPHTNGETHTFDRVLGYAPKPNIKSGTRLTSDDNLIFDFTYHTDAYRRRIVPGQTDSADHFDRALLFFGGSYAFGEGVSDEETLPSQVAAWYPDTHAYNYAFSGYGPSQILARLESYPVAEEVLESDVAAVYVFIPNHVRRVIGALSVITWSRHAPYYRPSDDGSVYRAGSFQRDRPIRTWWYEFLHDDQVLQYFHADLPRTLRPEHFELTAAIVGGAAREFERTFDSEEFYVVIFPASPNDEFSGQKMVPYFEDVGLKVLDYSTLFESGSKNAYFLPYDPHPTARAYRELAKALIQDPDFAPAKTP